MKAMESLFIDSQHRRRGDKFLALDRVEMTILDRPLKHLKVGGLVGAVASWEEASSLDQVGECRRLRLQRGLRLARFPLRARPTRWPFVSPTQAPVYQRIGAAIPIQVGREDRGRGFG